MQKLAIFDVCDTLFFSNTTFDFIAFYLKERGAGRQLKQLKNISDKREFRFWTNWLLGKWTGRDLAKKQAIRYLKGESKDELYRLARVFYKERLVPRKIGSVFQLFQQYQENKTPIQLLSASIDPIISAIADDLDVSFACTQLEYTNEGICTGRVAYEMKGRKDQEADHKLHSTEWWVEVVTDNFSDETLVKRADQAYVVAHRSKAAKFWKKSKAIIIDPHT